MMYTPQEKRSRLQSPDLFAAVICDVPLLDMIHYDQLKMAKSWRSEYGDPADPEHFAFLHAYSPYHNVVPSAFPAVLLSTAVNDSRVDAMHARKMAAKLQETTSSDRPILLFVEDDAGHGDGKPKDKVHEAGADKFAFLRSILGE